ncbi:unnamed protein product, partial [Iphiclides podalirius]
MCGIDNSTCTRNRVIERANIYPSNSGTRIAPYEGELRGAGAPRLKGPNGIAIVPCKTYPQLRVVGKAAAAAAAHSQTAHVHGRAPVAYWRATAAGVHLYLRARRARRPTRRGGLTAGAVPAPTCPLPAPPGTGRCSKTKRSTKDVPRMLATVRGWTGQAAALPTVPHLIQAESGMMVDGL